MRATATAKIKITTTPEIIETIKVYSKGLQHCIDTGWIYSIQNNFELHHIVYRDLRYKYKLPAQLAVACIKQACGMMKKAKNKPMIKNTSVGYNFPRSANLKGNILNIRTLNKREEFNITIPKCYQEYFNWTLRESLLYMDKKNRCFFLFTFSKEINTTKSNSCSQQSVLGVDLGVNNLAVTSDNRFFKSSKVKIIKRKFRYLRSKLQNKGTRSSKKLLKKISGRETRFMSWVNHNISKEIVSNFNGNKIVFEKLKGIRNKNRGKRMNYWISNWSFDQLQSFIQYKAERRSIDVIKVKPHYTSQICHRCGQLGTRLSANFKCLHCNFTSYNADLNAARNLAHPMLVERQAAVTQPHSRCVDTEAINGIEVEHMTKNLHL